MLRTTFLVVVGMVALGGCKATPTLDGTSLTCSADDTCPGTMRCFQGGCVRNSPPRIEPLGLRFVAPNTAFTASAVVTDAENDPITVTWTQLYDASVLAETHTGDTLAVTPAEQGTYVFEIVGTDGHDAAVAYLTLIAIDQPPADGSVYVADTGSDSEGCGTPSAPCATLEMGLEQGGTIVLAATQRSTAYNHCVNATANESIWGGFDADNWRYHPLLIPRTEITCTVGELDTDPNVAATGHVLFGTSTIGHVTLRLIVDAGQITTWPEKYFVTVALSNSQTLWGADVLTPAVPFPSLSAGVLSDAPDGHLLGVDVRGDPGGLDAPSYTIGIGAIGGRLEVAALEGRGRVLLTEPTTIGAVGIENTAAEVIVSGIEIRGGVAASQLGVLSHGGDTIIEDSTIDLRSFGTFHLVGISNGPLCDGPSCANPTPAALTATNNTIRLHGAVQAIVATCIGVGIQHLSAATTLEQVTVSDNTIELDGDIGLAVGMSALGGGATLSGNTVTVYQSLAAQAGCPQYVLEEYPSSPTTQGALGAVLGGAHGDTLTRNTITIQARAGDAFGIYAQNVDGVLISENVVTVATASEPVSVSLWSPAVAAELANDDPTLGPSMFERNELRVGSYAGNGAALRLRGITRWRVVNNTLYGGDTNYNVGLRIDQFTTDDAWPKMAHNTIFGGTGLVSEAVRTGIASHETTTEEVAQPPGPIGMFVNNILDAGDGSGRRFVLDNRQAGTEDPLGHALGNVAQVAGTGRPPPRAAAALVTADLAGLILQTGQLHLALPDSGTFATFEMKRNAPEISLEGWAPVGYAFTSVWVGNNDATTVGPLAITAAPGLLSMSGLGETTFDNFVTFPLKGWDDAPLAPTLLILGEVTGAPPLDVVFTTDTEVWAAAGQGRAGDGIAFLAQMTNSEGVGLAVDQPDFLGLTYSDPDLQATDRFYIVDQADVAPRLVIWPEFIGSDALVLPTAVTSFAAGQVGGTNFDGDLELQPVVAAVGFVPGAVYERVVYLTAPDGVMAPKAVALPDSTCGGDNEYVSSVKLLPTGCGGWCNNLWVGCENGRVQVFELIIEDNITGWALAPGPILDSATGLPVASLGAYNNYIVVSHVNSPLVTVIPPNNLPVPVSFTLVGDVGLRTNWPESLYRDTSSLAALGVDLGTCNLALRADPAVPHDLSLAAGPDDCDNAGTPLDDAVDPYPELSVTEDIEGDPRDLAQPEVGADER